MCTSDSVTCQPPCVPLEHHPTMRWRLLVGTMCHWPVAQAPSPDPSSPPAPPICYPHTCSFVRRHPMGAACAGCTCQACSIGAKSGVRSPAQSMPAPYGGGPLGWTKICKGCWTSRRTIGLPAGWIGYVSSSKGPRGWWLWVTQRFISLGIWTSKKQWVD